MPIGPLSVVGRMESSVGLIDHYEFLSEDQCGQPLITHGHLWSNKIQIWPGWDPGMPKPPRAKLQLEPPALAAKLLIVRGTRKLGFHDEPFFKKDGNSLVYAGTTPKPNEWAAVYGRIMKNPDLNKDCDVEDCGGHSVPLMVIAEPYNVHKLAEDGRVLPERLWVVGLIRLGPGYFSSFKRFRSSSVQRACSSRILFRVLGTKVVLAP